MHSSCITVAKIDIISTAMPASDIAEKKREQSLIECCCRTNNCAVAGMKRARKRTFSCALMLEQYGSQFSAYALHISRWQSI